MIQPAINGLPNHTGKTCQSKVIVYYLGACVSIFTLFCMMSNSIKIIFYGVPETWIFISWELLYVFIENAKVTPCGVQIEKLRTCSNDMICFPTLSS